MELTVNMCGRQELARKLLAEVIPPEACKDIYSPKPAFLQKPFLWLSHSFRGELKCARVCEIAAAHSGDELVLQSFSKFFQQEHWIKTAHFHLKIAALTWLYPPKAFWKLCSTTMHNLNFFLQAAFWRTAGFDLVPYSRKHLPLSIKDKEFLIDQQRFCLQPCWLLHAYAVKQTCKLQKKNKVLSDYLSPCLCSTIPMQKSSKQQTIKAQTNEKWMSSEGL